MQIRQFALLTLLTLILLYLIPLQSFSSESKDEKLYQKAMSVYKGLKASPTRKGNGSKWEPLAEGFYNIYRTYPNSPRADDALFMAAKVYEQIGIKFGSKEALEKSISLSKELVEIYLKSHFADDAQLRIARAVEKRDKEKAYLEYEAILKKFPEGDMVEIAQKKLIELKRYKPPPATSGSLAEVLQIRHWSAENYTRVVIDVEEERPFTHQLLRPVPSEGIPPRLYVDIGRARIDPRFDIPNLESGFLEKIKVGQNTPDTVRVVLYIESFKTYRVFPIYEPFRIVMDIYGDKASQEPQAKNGVKKDRGGREKEDLSKLRGALGLKVRTVVIDPGHGGHDPGAIGPTGLREKDVTLKIAKSLKKWLEKEGYTTGITRTVLTREDDRFIPLEERTAIAKKHGADLFISIHCNAHRKNGVYGVETYFLSFTDDPEAIQIAARENVTTTKRISDLKDIIKNYLLNSKIDESSRLARYVQGSVVDHLGTNYTNINNKGVKKAPFIVLIGADIPSVLVEASYISNPREEQRLRDSRYIDKLAEGILSGIKSYVTGVETASASN